MPFVLKNSTLSTAKTLSSVLAQMRNKHIHLSRGTPVRVSLRFGRAELKVSLQGDSPISASDQPVDDINQEAEFLPSKISKFNIVDLSLAWREALQQGIPLR